MVSTCATLTLVLLDLDTTMVKIETIKEKLNLNPKKIKGCSESEIRLLEERLGVNFPYAYKFFLGMMGHSADHFFLGSDFTYNELEQLQDWAKELLGESDEYPNFPADAFVFIMHQGYQFFFFYLNESDNPTVYGYLEGNSYFDKFEKFDDFLLTSADSFT